jgi:hypothetical protein
MAIHEAGAGHTAALTAPMVRRSRARPRSGTYGLRFLHPSPSQSHSRPRSCLRWCAGECHSDGNSRSPHGAAFSLAERLRRTFHRIGPARVPRSRDRADGRRPSPRVKGVRRLLLTNANAPRLEQRCTPSPSCRAAGGWTCDRHSARRWFAPPLRAARRVVRSLPCRSPPWPAGTCAYAHCELGSQSKECISRSG